MKTIDYDLLACGAENPSLKNKLVYYFTHPEFKVILNYRIYSSWYLKGTIRKYLGKYLWLRTVKNFGCYISPHAKIGKGLRLPHPTGIVIGDGIVIGENVHIYQHVTLGDKGTGQHYPTVKDNVTIYAGACVLGEITVNEHAIIGANAVVIDDVPKLGIAVGVPAKIINQSSQDV